MSVLNRRGTFNDRAINVVVAGDYEDPSQWALGDVDDLVNPVRGCFVLCWRSLERDVPTDENGVHGTKLDYTVANVVQHQGANVVIRVEVRIEATRGAEMDVREVEQQHAAILATGEGIVARESAPRERGVISRKCEAALRELPMAPASAWSPRRRAAARPRDNR